MEDWFKYLITESISHALIIIILVTFLESLALVGLILPGIFFMTTLGALIGNGKIPFYPAWITGIIGCLSGDYLSYYIGWQCKDWIHNINLFNKNIKLFDKIKNTLYQYSMITILFGKFIGPIRPLVPMIAGMIKLPIQRFIAPSLIGSILWPLLYFLPGMITGIIMHHPNFPKDQSIKWILLLVFINIWMGSWLTWKCWNHHHNNDISNKFPKKNIILLIIINILISIIGLIYIQHHMKIMIIKEIFFKIFNI